MKTIWLIAAVIVLATGCNKKNSAGRGVEFYKLQNFQMVAGKCQVETTGVQFVDNPIVANSDIASYDQITYTFTLKPAAMLKIKGLMDNDALALFVNGEPLYYFINKPMYSSSSCGESITMSAWNNTSVTMHLGYPTSGSTVTDLRNHGLLLQTLRSQGKLR